MSDNIQDVRNRIIQLAREIEEASKSGMPAQQFFRLFIKNTVGAVGARAGAVWMRNGSNRLDLVCEQGLQQTDFYNNPNAATANQKLLSDVISNGQARTCSPEDSSTSDLPTDDLIVLAALQREKECVGVVEIFQRKDTPPDARPGFLQFVEQMSGYACRYLDNQTLVKSPTTKAQISEQFERFLLQLHRGLVDSEVAATAANDGRLLLGCDRVSAAVQYGNKTVIRAISGQDAVNQRANLVRTMTKLASRVVAMREPMTYTGKVDHLPPQIEAPLADYIQESGSRMVLVVPLFETGTLIEKDDDTPQARRRERPMKPIGGLIVEQINESTPKPGLLEKVDLITDHVACALTNARTHQRLFLMPVWRALGQSFSWLEGRNWMKVAGGFLLIAAVILAMVFVPWDYRVEGEGHLMPSIQRDVFAPWDGHVVEIWVQHGQLVKAGDKLLLIQNEELQAELLTARKEREEKLQLISALETERAAAQRTPETEDDIRLAGKIAETKIEIESASDRVKILEERQKRLLVTAPTDGVVATFQIEQLLQNRPVRRGEVLVEIKDPKGPWRLELEIEEHRMGHIFDGQKKFDTPNLPVEFVLATAAERTFDGKLQDISTRTDASDPSVGGDTAVVRAYVSIDDDPEKLPNRRIGSEVRAKINCGKRSLGYVLFGDVVEFLQKYFWL